MYILSDGKNYVMENPMKIGEYLSTTSPVHAKEFSYKQARALIQSNRKKWAWMKQYHLIGTDEESDTVENSVNYRGKANTYNDSSEFDMKIPSRPAGATCWPRATPAPTPTLTSSVRTSASKFCLWNEPLSHASRASRSPFDTCVSPPPAGGVFPIRGALGRAVRLEQDKKTVCFHKMPGPAA